VTSAFLIGLIGVAISSVYFALDAQNKELLAFDNESFSLSALAGSIVENHSTRAVKLALAAWTIDSNGNTPSYEKAIDTLSGAIQKNRLSRVFQNDDSRIIHDTEISADGRLVAIASSKIHIWETDSASLFATFEPKKHGIENSDKIFAFATISRVSFARDRPHLAFVAHNSAYVWSYITDEIVQKSPLEQSGKTDHIIFVGEIDQMVTASTGGKLESRKLGVSGEPQTTVIRTLSGLPEEIDCLFSSDDGTLFLVSTGGRIHVFRSSTLGLVCATKSAGRIYSVDFFDSEGFVITTDAADGSIDAMVLDFASNCIGFKRITWVQDARNLVHLVDHWYAALESDRILIGMLNKSNIGPELVVFGTRRNDGSGVVRYSEKGDLLLVDDISFRLTFSKSIFLTVSKKIKELSTVVQKFPRFYLVRV